jgi:hypothetical protein
VRITIRIDDQLHAEAKKRAAEQGSTLTALIEDSLRTALVPGKPAHRRERFRITSFRGEGVLPGVDLDNSASLLDRMEGIDSSD